MNQKQSKKRTSKINQKMQELRKKLFADLNPNDLWNRQKEKGFTTIPRTLSMIMNMLDILCKNKPVSKTYFTLWCRSFDEMIVSIKNEADYAHESGFSGQRAIVTWRERMSKLEELGLILTKSGTAGKFGYVVLLDPHKVIEKLHRENPQVLQTHYDVYTERCLFIGKDLDFE